MGVLIEKKNGYDVISEAEKALVEDYCKEYIRFLDSVKTERECVREFIGLAEAKDVEHTEQQLMQNIPEQDWGDAHHWLIYHGRQVCAAQRPKCETCPLKEICTYAVHR